jgi:uncharacterized protein (TIGR02271 family)
MNQVSNDGDASSLSAQLRNARVVDAGGKHASILALQEDGLSDPHALVQLDEGTNVLVPLKLMTAQADGSYRLPFTFQTAAEDLHSTQIRFPLLAEELQVGKRRVETGGGVRLHKSVTEREEVLDQPLLHDELVVEHVPIGRVVAADAVPRVRYEGDTLVVPVLEEVLVVQKQLLLKEELRVTRKQNEVHAPQTVVLRSEQIKIERF